VRCLRVRPFACGVLAVAAICMPARAADKEQEADVLISRAAALTNLAAAQTPFRLALRWKVLNLASGPADGHYSMQWSGADQWREETGFQGFDQTQVVVKGRLWTSRNIDFLPKPAFQLRTLLDTLWYLARSPDETVKKVSKRTIHGVKATCVDLLGGRFRSRSLCFSESGELVQASLANPEGSYEYSDYSTFDSLRFPRAMCVVSGGSTAIEVTVEELSLLKAPAPDGFAPPRGARESALCLRPAAGKILHMVRPRYPELAKSQHLQGTVSLYVSIGKDGRVQRTRVIQSAGAVLDKAAEDGVQQWKYEPFVCAGEAVEVETEVDVTFSFSAF
jgi:TonB family protein